MNLDELQSLYDFSDRTVLITGGAGVLGAGIAHALLGCHANVVILNRDPEKARKALDGFPKDAKGRAISISSDVLNAKTLHKARDTILAEFSAVDILINAAGGNHPLAITSDQLSFFDLPQEALQYVADLNLLGTVLPCQIFGRDMAERGEGVILNISSMNAFRPLTRIPAYAAAKAGVSNFTQWLAVHMAQNYSPRIRVNAIAPGFFLTEINRFLLVDKESGEPSSAWARIIDHTPMNRFGVPEDLLGAALWLISPAASFVTGAVIPIDGGFSAFSGV